MSHSYRDLVAWREAKNLAVEVYRLSEKFPKQEIYGLTSQVRRAAISVVSNIAEGQGRLTQGEFVQFLGHSRGSLLEVLTQLEISVELGYLNGEDFRILDSKAATVLRLLNGLLASMRNRSKAASAE
ncbi:MAG TPA: four helix bundle protein [Terriglobales bacterium]|nr:four helix bundle protein [Terriglobales bacterium]